MSRWGIPECLQRARLGGAQQALELGKHLLDGVQVRAVGRQIPQRSACPINGRLDPDDLVRAQVVHNHDVARAQLRHQKLLHPGQKRISIDRPGQHQRRQKTLAAERADKRRGVPMSARRVPQAALALGRAAPGGRHVSCGPCLIQKNQPLVRRRCLHLGPLLAFVRYAAALLLGRIDGLFFRVNPSRLSVLPMVVGPACTPCSA